MVGQRVSLEIVPHIAIGPLENGKKLGAGLFLDEYIESLPRGGGTPTKACDPERWIKFCEGTLERLDPNDFMEFF